MKYHLYLKEKPIEDGLSQTEIKEMLDAMPEDEELVPLDIELSDGSSIYGFVTTTLYERLDWFRNAIDDFAERTLITTDSTIDDVFTDEIEGFPVYACR